MRALLGFLDDQGFGHDAALRAWLLPLGWEDETAAGETGWALLLLHVSKLTDIPLGELRQELGAAGLGKVVGQRDE